MQILCGRHWNRAGFCETLSHNATNVPHNWALTSPRCPLKWTSSLGLHSRSPSLSGCFYLGPARRKQPRERGTPSCSGEARKLSSMSTDKASRRPHLYIPADQKVPWAQSWPLSLVRRQVCAPLTAFLRCHSVFYLILESSQMLATRCRDTDSSSLDFQAVLANLGWFTCRVGWF